MKKTIEIAVSQTKINKIEQEIDLPEIPKYYSWKDDGRFFPRGLVLFAIIPYDEKTPYYTLVEVERNKQDCTDFRPTSDCKVEYWISNPNQLRKLAFNIITNKEWDFKECTKEYFDKERLRLLNSFMTD